jgi:hypothetical protein
MSGESRSRRWANDRSSRVFFQALELHPATADTLEAPRAPRGWRRTRSALERPVEGRFGLISHALVGVLAAHLMFGEAWFQLSQHARAGGSQLLSEFVATFGLLSVIWGCGRQRAESVPMAVGLYITSAYWFTASTSFANPAVTLARSFTDTFSGIRPTDVPCFIAAQLVGAIGATLVFRWLVPAVPSPAANVTAAARRSAV